MNVLFLTFMFSISLVVAVVLLKIIYFKFNLKARAGGVLARLLGDKFGKGELVMSALDEEEAEAEKEAVELQELGGD